MLPPGVSAFAQPVTPTAPDPSTPGGHSRWGGGGQGVGGWVVGGDGDEALSVTSQGGETFRD